MNGIVNAAPMAILNGVDDQSARSVSAQVNFSPIHMAFVPLYLQRGPLEPQQVVGSARTSVYGADSFNMRKGYANHGTVLSNVLNAAANPQVIARLKPKDAPDAATTRLSLELVAAQVPLYERDDTGAYKKDTKGNPIETGEKVAGYIGRWVKEQATGGVGQATVSTGELSSGGVTSDKYPIFEDRISSFGAWGNNVGRRIWAATAKSEPALDADVAQSEGTALFRLQYVERTNASSTPTITKTISEDPYVEFSLKPGAINPKIDADLFVDAVALKSYRNVDSTSSDTPVFGPVDKINIYHGYVSAVLKKIYAAECAQTGATPVDGGEYTMNILDGLDFDGNPYETLLIQGALDAGAAALTASSTHYSEGGGDGTMSDDLYAELVQELMLGFEDSEFNLMDMAKYPITTIWDTGFDLATKKTLLVPMGLRKDILTILATQDANEPVNTNATETSIALALRAAAIQYPESEYYGTETHRAAIFGQCGTLIDGSRAGIMPSTIEVAKKVAEYMGSEQGVMVSNKAFDRYPNTLVTTLRDVNATYKSSRARNTDWSNGLNWIQQYDQRQLFFPAYQTVYDEDTSVLNSLITSFITAYCEKIVVMTWKQLTGRSDLTKAQFIEQSNLLIADAVKNRFDNRVVIVPDTYFTAADDQRGYSWSCKVNVYANVMKTVGAYTIVTRRMEDLVATSA